MSKCQRGKFFAGGKAGAGSGCPSGYSGPNNIGGDMAALLAARDAQDRAWSTPATSEGQGSGPATPQKATPAFASECVRHESAGRQQLAIVQAQPANHKQMSKEEMMKIICSGDMSDED